MNENGGFIVTQEWLQQKFDEYNKSVFGGRLKPCKLSTFTHSRRGATTTRTAGYFASNRTGIKRESNGHLFVWGYPGQRIYLNSENFGQYFAPEISLNGTYKWTERDAIGTLLHEMVHYWNYKDGWAPKQGHGREFKDALYAVSLKTKIPFDELYSAEFVTLDTLQSSDRERLTNRVSRGIPIFVWKYNGQIDYVPAANQRVADDVIMYYKSHYDPNYIKVGDSNVGLYMFEKGFRSMIKTPGRYYDITSKDFLKELDGLNLKTVFVGRGACGKISESKKTVRLRESDVRRIIRESIKRIFF